MTGAVGTVAGRGFREEQEFLGFFFFFSVNVFIRIKSRVLKMKNVTTSLKVFLFFKVLVHQKNNLPETPISLLILAYFLIWVSILFIIISRHSHFQKVFPLQQNYYPTIIIGALPIL